MYRRSQREKSSEDLLNMAFNAKDDLEKVLALCHPNSPALQALQNAMVAKAVDSLKLEKMFERIFLETLRQQHQEEVALKEKKAALEEQSREEMQQQAEALAKAAQEEAAEYGVEKTAETEPEEKEKLEQEAEQLYIVIVNLRKEEQELTKDLALLEQNKQEIEQKVEKQWQINEKQKAKDFAENLKSEMKDASFVSSSGKAMPLTNELLENMTRDMRSPAPTQVVKYNPALARQVETKEASNQMDKVNLLLGVIRAANNLVEEKTSASGVDETSIIARFKVLKDKQNQPLKNALEKAYLQDQKRHHLAASKIETKPVENMSSAEMISAVAKSNNNVSDKKDELKVKQDDIKVKEKELDVLNDKIESYRSELDPRDQDNKMM